MVYICGNGPTFAWSATTVMFIGRIFPPRPKVFSEPTTIRGDSGHRVGIQSTFAAWTVVLSPPSSMMYRKRFERNGSSSRLIKCGDGVSCKRKRPRNLL